MDERSDYSKIRLTASKAIRLKCLDCCCENSNAVRECNIVKCPLWRYRFGRELKDELNTRQARILTDEQREEMRLRMQKARGGNHA